MEKLFWIVWLYVIAGITFFILTVETEYGRKEFTKFGRILNIFFKPVHYLFCGISSVISFFARSIIR